eukprot:765715-Hanusia_phi.AAC.4
MAAEAMRETGEEERRRGEVSWQFPCHARIPSIFFLLIGFASLQVEAFQVIDNRKIRDSCLPPALFRRTL